MRVLLVGTAEGYHATFRMMNFIRYGRWCECERSCNTARGSLEQGLSVYACRKEQNTWVPLGPAWTKNKDTTKAPDAMWFLVEGQMIGSTGSDREPLIRNVTPVAFLKWNDNASVEVGNAKNANVTNPHEKDARGYCRCQNSVEFFTQMTEDEDEDYIFE